MKRTNWFDRKFAILPDNGLLPSIIERLEGTPARLEEKLKDVNFNNLKTSGDGKWSIKKEIGHLTDLEPLWLERIKEVIAGKADLREADLTNRKTHDSHHDKQQISNLINDFRANRHQMIDLLRNTTDEDLGKSSKHPRLGTPMRIVDLTYFIAEHDDHHLARITFLKNITYD